MDVVKFTACISISYFVQSFSSSPQLDQFKSLSQSYWFHVIAANEIYSTVRQQFHVKQPLDAAELYGTVQEQFIEAQKYLKLSQSIYEKLNNGEKTSAETFHTKKVTLRTLFFSFEDIKNDPCAKHFQISVDEQKTDHEYPVTPSTPDGSRVAS